MMMHKNASVDPHRFAMIPKAEIPRAAFDRQFTHKTTFDAGYLVPVYVDEVLPGDTFNLKMTAFARMATPLFPTMDNLYIDSFFFFVPNRLIWENWERFMGSQDNPDDSISYVIPTTSTPANGYAVGSIFDYMGLPTVGQVGTGNTVSHSVLHLRAYNLIFNQWFRDENLQDSVTVNTGDGPDTYTDYTLLKRGKRKDYFTAALPWPQKGTAVSLPLGTSAPLKSDFATEINIGTFDRVAGASNPLRLGNQSGTDIGSLYADLSNATAATINQLRQSFQIQKLLERDARGGTRYIEIIRSHFGVVSPDARMQRPEYLGGGTTPVNVSPVAQNSVSAATPQGNLAGVGNVTLRNGFVKSFTEHCVLLGLVNVRADLTYQQGFDRMHLKDSKFDFVWPEFAHLSEQPVFVEEVYAKASAGGRNRVIFGYQGRYNEYRYRKSRVCGTLRSDAAGSLDYWHLDRYFDSEPGLNEAFVSCIPRTDIFPVPAAPGILMQVGNGLRVARPLPASPEPGLLDHF